MFSQINIYYEIMDCSVLILTENEESNIRACIESCRQYSDEIIIDDMSNDRTEELATTAEARVYIKER